MNHTWHIHTTLKTHNSCLINRITKEIMKITRHTTTKRHCRKNNKTHHAHSPRTNTHISSPCSRSVHHAVTRPSRLVLAPRITPSSPPSTTKVVRNFCIINHHITPTNHVASVKTPYFPHIARFATTHQSHQHDDHHHGETAQQKEERRKQVLLNLAPQSHPLDHATPLSAVDADIDAAVAVELGARAKLHKSQQHDHHEIQHSHPPHIAADAHLSQSSIDTYNALLHSLSPEHRIVMDKGDIADLDELCAEIDAKNDKIADFVHHQHYPTHTPRMVNAKKAPIGHAGRILEKLKNHPIYPLEPPKPPAVPIPPPSGLTDINGNHGEKY